jgi:hypothetical protein
VILDIGIMIAAYISGPLAAGSPSEELRIRSIISRLADISGMTKLSRAGPPRRRGREFEGRTLLFLTVIGIVGAASAGSLFSAAFVLLAAPKTAMRPAALSVVRMQPTPAAGTANPLCPASPAASPPPTAAPPRIAAVPASSAASPPPAIVRFAMAQGDASFADGEVSAARFYYLQAVDAGDADAAVRIGETFDPAFLTRGRSRRALANREAARFWYWRALDLGATRAKQRLENLETELVVGSYTDKDK